MNRQFIEKIEKAVREWAQQYPNIELAAVEVHPGSVPNAFHVIVAAAKGFENWEQTEREDDLYWFLRKKPGAADIVKISILLALTEEEYENYEIASDEVYN